MVEETGGVGQEDGLMEGQRRWEQRSRDESEKKSSRATDAILRLLLSDEALPA